MSASTLLTGATFLAIDSFSFRRLSFIPTIAALLTTCATASCCAQLLRQNSALLPLCGSCIQRITAWQIFSANRLLSDNAILPSFSLSHACLDAIRQLHPLTIVHGMVYDAAQSLVTFSHPKPFHWSTLNSARPGGSFHYHDLESGVATKPFPLSTLYAVWQPLDVITASRQAHDYFGVENRNFGPTRDTDGRSYTAEVLKLNMAPAVPTATSFSPGTFSSSSSLPSSPQASMVGPSSCVSMASPALVLSSSSAFGPHLRCWWSVRRQFFLCYCSRLCLSRYWRLAQHLCCTSWTITGFSGSCLLHFSPNSCGHGIDWIVAQWYRWRWCVG